MKPVTEIRKPLKGEVHCPICTHNVAADIDVIRKVARVVPGQKCSRCASPLDAAFVLEVTEAA